MEAITIAPEMFETPAASASAVSWQASGMVRAAAVGLVFSVAFSSSFVLGFYLLGPWIDATRIMM